METPRIIDTNVPLTAINPDAVISCRSACVKTIDQILKGEVGVVIDEHGDALREYRTRMYPDPRPSAGLASQFLMYLINYQHDVSRVRRVRLQKDSEGRYVCFPQDDALAQFDLSDHKWVAIAITFEQETGNKAPVINATDSDWLHFEQVLNRFGVQIKFLCRDLLKPKEG